jgi:hypothetical protein
MQLLQQPAVQAGGNAVVAQGGVVDQVLCDLLGRVDLSHATTGVKKWSGHKLHDFTLTCDKMAARTSRRQQNKTRACNRSQLLVSLTADILRIERRQISILHVTWPDSDSRRVMSGFVSISSL